MGIVPWHLNFESFWFLTKWKFRFPLSPCCFQKSATHAFFKSNRANKEGKVSHKGSSLHIFPKLHPPPITHRKGNLRFKKFSPLPNLFPKPNPIGISHRYWPITSFFLPKLSPYDFLPQWMSFTRGITNTIAKNGHIDQRKRMNT